MNKSNLIDKYTKELLGGLVFLESMKANDVRGIIKSKLTAMAKELIEDRTLYVVGCASAKIEDIGTPKADPDSDYNQGYKDATNKLKSYQRQKAGIR